MTVWFDDGVGNVESGRDNVHDDKRSGRPSVVTPDLVQQIEVKIRENRRFIFTDPAEF